MKNFTKAFIPMAFCFALLLSAFTVSAQTDERPDNMEQLVPMQPQSVSPVIPNAEKNVSRSEDNSMNPTFLVPPAAKKVKSKKGFFGKLFHKLNPLNWFKDLKAQLSTGVMLMLIGLGMIIIGYVLIFSVYSGNFSGALLGVLLIYVGWIVFVVGAILWLIDLIQNS